MKKLFKLLLLTTLLSCGGDKFYESYQIDDLWRLPLIEPYELKNVAGAKQNQSNNGNWHLAFKELKVDNIVKGLNITMINVDKSIIYGYGTSYPSYHFLVNCKTGEEKIFKAVSDWQRELNNLGVDNKNLFDVFDVFEEFKNKNILPWGKEIK